jgi:hypothetical protein
MGVDIIAGLISTLGGMVLPPVIDFIKKKFIPAENDTPERTLATLATTNPDVMPKYLESLSLYLKAQGDFFNRDVVGTPSFWVIDLRAAIRPIAVVFAFSLLGLQGLNFLTVDPVTRDGLLVLIGNWFGSRIFQR